MENGAVGKFVENTCPPGCSSRARGRGLFLMLTQVSATLAFGKAKGDPSDSNGWFAGMAQLAVHQLKPSRFPAL